MNRPKIFLFAGENSGDLLGQGLVKILIEKMPQARIYGVGGPLMRKAGLETILAMEKFQVMGFLDVLIASPRLIKGFFYIRNTLLDNPPDLVLTIDYPGFSLALAQSLRNKKFPGKIYHYVCPSVWAWGKGRISKIEQRFDHLFVTFPFEQDLFDPQKLPISFVGHPRVKQIKSHQASQVAPIDTPEGKRVIALFPGSRKKEIDRNFPIQLQVTLRLREKFPDLFIVISVAHPQFSYLMDEWIKKTGVKRESLLFIDSKQNPSLMQKAVMAIAKSGTNNLELALFGVPTVVVYGIGPIDLFIAQKILKIDLPYYSIVNILASKEIFPELIGPKFTEQSLFEHAHYFLENPKHLRECREKCQEIVKIMGNHQPEEQILKEIEKIFDGKNRS